MSYGTKEGNYFKADPNIKGGDKLQDSKYALVIEDEGSSTPGLITIWDSQLLLGVPNSREVGTISVDGTFTPNPGYTVSEEVEYFSNPDVTKAVKNQAIITATKAQTSEGVNPEDAEKRSRELIETGKTETATDRTNVDRATDQFNITSFNVAKGKARDNYPENLTYPEKLDTTKQDCIKFSIKELTKVSFNPTLGEKSFNKTYTNVTGSVILPIQPSITDGNNVRWGSSDFNAIQAFGVATSVNLATAGNIDSLISELGDISNTALKKIFEKGNNQYKQAIGLYLAEQAVGSQGLLSRATGTVLNPNMELLFQGPDLRSFAFQFKLSPRSDTEAKKVKQIIRFFKQAMSVKTTASSVFLKSPHVFDIRYLSNNEDHKSLNRIKTCALISCDVDYTPDGSYMTFNDPEKTMTSYGLTLRFNELEPIYDSDYNTGSGADGTTNIHTNITEDEIGF